MDSVDHLHQAEEGVALIASSQLFVAAQQYVGRFAAPFEDLVLGLAEAVVLGLAFLAWELEAFP